MTIKECYDNISADFEGVLSRLMRDTIVQKFALKFVNDGSFAELRTYLFENNTSDAFRAAHTLKGVTQNLAFTALAEKASVITEMLRAGELEKAKEYFPAVELEYNKTVNEIKKLEAQ